MKKPFRLKKNKNGIYYYKTDEQTCFHSTGSKNKREAESFILKKITEDVKPILKITVKEFCSNLFIAGKCEHIKRKASRGKPYSQDMLKMRRGHLVNYIVPALGNYKLEDLKAHTIDLFLRKLTLSNQTKNHILGSIKIMLSEASYQGLCTSNCGLNVELFVKDTKTRDILTQQEIRCLFPSDTADLIRVWKSERNAALFSFLLTTGARLSEALALMWEDIDFTSDTVVIRKSLKNRKEIGTTKTKKNSIVPFLQNTKQIFLHHYQTSKPSSKDLVFKNIINDYALDRKTCTTIFRGALQTCGIDKAGRNIVIHSFRHLFNTLAMKEIDSMTLRLITSHSDEKMTNHYNHPSESELRAKVAKVTPTMNRLFDLESVNDSKI